MLQFPFTTKNPHFRPILEPFAPKNQEQEVFQNNIILFSAYMLL